MRLKKNRHLIDTILKTLVAFYNNEGGRIYIGIVDGNDHDVVGVKLIGNTMENFR